MFINKTLFLLEDSEKKVKTCSQNPQDCGPINPFSFSPLFSKIQAAHFLRISNNALPLGHPNRMILDYEQSLFPLRDSRAKQTREQARAKLACRIVT